MTDRRKFLRQSAQVGAAALVLPLWACNNAKPASTTGSGGRADRAPTGDLDAYGLQLFTLRDEMPNDPKGTLQKIAEMGYTQIEGYEGDMGMFWGMEPQEFKGYLDGLGLTMVSSHCNINENFAEKAQQAASIGMEYLICPYIGTRDDRAGWQEVVEQFNACGKTCADNGLRFAYHNHEYTFKEVDGIVPQAFLMDNTDETVAYEMDIYWVVTAAEDPITWLNRYPEKWTLCHVKDRMKGADPAEMEASVNLGQGSIDFPAILSVAEEQGMEYYILEQEKYEGTTPLKAAASGAQYLQKFKFA